MFKFLPVVFVALPLASQAYNHTITHPTCQVFFSHDDLAPADSVATMKSALLAKGYKIARDVSGDDALIADAEGETGNPNLVYFNSRAYKSDDNKCVATYELVRQWKDGIGTRTQNLYALNTETETPQRVNRDADCYGELVDFLPKIPNCVVKK